MWKAPSILSILAMFIVTRLAEAGYYEYGQGQYRHGASFKCTKEGYYSDLHDCRIYYRCVDWGNSSPLTTFRFECGPGTVFSKDKGNICTHPEDSGRPECAGSGNELDSNLNDPLESLSPIWMTTVKPTTLQHTTTQSPVTIGLFITTTRKPETTTLLTSQPSTTQLENNIINCQNGSQCIQEGFLADYCDCRKFYRCVNEGYGKFRKYSFMCGIGTVWDPKIQGCNHAWAVTRENCKQENNVNNSGQWNGDTGDNTEQWDSDTGNSGQPENPNGQPGQPGQPGDLNGQPEQSGSPGTPGISSSPGGPGTPDITGSPDSPGYPGTSGFPGYPGIPGTPGSPGTVGSPGNTGSAAYPGTPGLSDVPSSSGISATPGSPGIPGSSESPDFPGYPGTLGSADKPGSLGISETPSSSAPPGIPGFPGSLGSTGYPGTSNSADTPGFPGTSEIQNTPENPGTSGSLGNPNSPNYPGIPGFPSTPSSPGTPGSAGTSGTSGSPGYPGIPISSSIPDSSGIPEISGTPSFPDNLSSGFCTEEGFFADPKDCRKFYRCVDNNMFTKYEFQCGVGTVWDSSIQSCNHIYAVPRCNQPNNAITNESDTSVNEIDNTDKPDTSKLPSVQFSESSTVSSSPKPDIWSSTQTASITGKPSAPSMLISYVPSSNTTYSPSITQVTESISYLPPATEMSTSVSYLSSSSIATSTTTVSHLLSGVSTPMNTKPTMSTLPSPASSSVSSTHAEKFDCTEEGFFPNPDDCRKFYRCIQSQSGYRKYKFQCGPGTAWDQSVQTCNYIEQVASCSIDMNEIAQGPRPSTSNPASESAIASSSTISSQSTTTTSSSTISIPTRSTAISIPVETSTESLMPEAEVSLTTFITTISTSEKPTLSPGKPDSVQMSGNGFSTESSLESSSSGQFTSESNEESSTESQVSDCTTRKPNNTIVCNDEGFYPHSTWCDKFYRCVDNGNGFNVYHFDCPPGTIFDPSIKVCNYPESVYPTRDCTTGSATPSNIPTTAESTTLSEKPEQLTEIITPQSTTQQTEESTITSTQLDTTTSSMEIATSEENITASSTESTSKMPDITESTVEYTTESTAITEAAINSGTTETTTEFGSMETETPTTESQKQSTTESLEQSTKSQEQSTTEFQEQSTIESQESSSTQTQEQSTTQWQEQSVTESQEQTTTELSEPTTATPVTMTPCPIGNLTDDQITLICPTGFRRHPKYCNLFYQCISEGNMEIKILILSCPENTIFDEKKIQCLPASRSSQPCTGAKANARFYRRLEDNTLSPMKVSSSRLCPGEGHFPYRQGCSNIFYKCKRNTRDSLQGYFYKCPDNFIYWSVSRRCERVTHLPMCSHLAYRHKTDWNDRWQIPSEDFNLSARMLRFS